jgi:acetyl-CoA carboxylase, biotin carboxylase subunit
MLKRVLIANRGEIALRIIRGCRELGIESVAVFSDADRFAPFARAADYAFPIGAPPALQSYLCGDRIIATAKSCGADGLHPGYGFLAENADFAAAVIAAGLVWIGPPPGAIRAMGDKLSARQLMQKAGVPVTPGLYAEAGDAESVAQLCETIGYPVLIKAAAGGGGKGMRIVSGPSELASHLERARSEALKSFSDARVYIEQYLERPRHVEIQVIADANGSAVHLGERECSIQRRYQKVIEESPSPAVNESLRQRMGEAAVRAALECGYVGAGTVEFLLDETGSFYFLEMNTRLQVEHPVTEMVTGRDLVALQLAVASGEPLGFSQADVSLRGHAFECRIYAEDPESNFMPSVGKLLRYREPAGPGVRVDSGVEEGDLVSLYYDPQLAKLITHGATRESARRRMLRALSEYQIAGVKHNIPLLERVFEHPEFVAGRLSTHFLSDFGLLQPAASGAGPHADAILAAAIYAARKILAVKVQDGNLPQAEAPQAPRRPKSGWREAGRRAALRAGGVA